MLHELTFRHGNFMSGCTARVDKHFEGYHTVQFMTDGAVEIFYDEQHYELRGQWFWPAYPGPHIRFHAARGVHSWDHRYVAFNGPLVNRWKAAGLWLPAPQLMPAGRDYPALFDELLKNLSRSDRWGSLRAANLLESILVDLAESRTQSSAREPWLEEVLEQLDSQQDFCPDYEAIATRCGMALSTLRRRFRDVTGSTLHGYVLQNRMARARELLGNGDLPLKAIAERLGYNDVYFFSNQFRQHAGVPPAAYRRSRQA